MRAMLLALAASLGCAGPAGEPGDVPPGSGSKVGDRIADFTLPDCDGNAVRLADVLAGGEAALVVVAAGWCASCVKEAETLERDVADRWGPRGLRVLQVLFEDALGAPAGPQFCREWRDRFGLSFPVVVDADAAVAGALGAGGAAATPLNLVTDREAVVLYRAAGPVPPDLAPFLEGLLPPER
jgi:peroxiredoxin